MRSGSDPPRAGRRGDLACVCRRPAL